MQNLKRNDTNDSMCSFQIPLAPIIISFSEYLPFRNLQVGTSPVVQWLRLLCFHCRGRGLDPWLVN